MNSLLQRANRRVSWGNAALLLVTSSFGAQLLGFLRTKLVNANFSPTGPHSTDAYFAAFNIPDFFFYTIAAGALGVAFIPVLTDRLSKNDKKGAIDLSNSLLTLLVMVMAVVGVIMYFFAGPLIHHIVAPGLSPEQTKTATEIMRLIAFNPLLFTISGVLTGYQQSIGRFFFYAVAPIFYNLTIIISIYIFKDNIGLVGLGIGALGGAIIQLAIVLLGLFGLKFTWRPKILWQNKEFKSILRNLPPRSIDQGIDQIESIAETNFATKLGSGNVTYYNNAYILSTAPILLIGSAITTAVFPRLTSRLSANRPDLFRKDFIKILRLLLWISSPVVVVSFFARGYLARLIFSRGSEQISLVFGFLCGAIFFNIIYALLSRWFYARKDTLTPLYVSLFIIALNIVLAYSLSKPTNYGVSGLAIAQTLVAAIQVSILFVIIFRKDPKIFDRYFWSGVLKIASVTGFSVLAGYIAVSFLPLEITDRGFITLGAKLSFITLITFVVHFGMSFLFGVEEVQPVYERVKRFILRPIKLEY